MAFCDEILDDGYIIPDCSFSTPGVKQFYIAKYDSNRGYTFDTTDLTITAISNAANAFYSFDQLPEIANYTDTITRNANGTVGVEYSLTLVFGNMSPETRNKANLLSGGQWSIISELENGELILIGETSPARIATSTGNSGTASGDSSGYTIAFTGKGKEHAHYLADNVLDTVLVGRSIQAPNDFYASALSATSVTLNWDAVATATGYIVERSLTADFAIITPVYTGALLTTVNPGLTTATHYYFRIKSTKTGITTSTWKVYSITTP